MTVYLEATTQLVDNQGGQSLLLNVLSHDHEGVTPLDGPLQDANNVTSSRDLLVNQQQLALIVLGNLHVLIWPGCLLSKGVWQ